MVKEKRDILTNAILGEFVTVITVLDATIEDSDGNLKSIPLVYEGVIKDLDDKVVILDPDNGESVKVIFRDHIVSVELVDLAKEAALVEKGNRGALN